MEEIVSKVKAFFKKSEEVVRSIEVNDWEVIGGCVVGSLLVTAFIGPVFASTLIGVLMGLIIQQKINLKR